MGADIPIASEFTQGLQPLLNQFGNNLDFSLILFNLDETNPMPANWRRSPDIIRRQAGSAWWFHDSLNGMRRYFDQVIKQPASTTRLDLTTTPALTLHSGTA